MAELVALIDGTTYPLDGCDWVMYEPCGCPSGIATAAAHQSEAEAWKAFFGRSRDRESARVHGVRMELLTSERTAAEVLPAYGRTCPHMTSPPHGRGEREARQQRRQPVTDDETTEAAETEAEDTEAEAAEDAEDDTGDGDGE